MTNQKDKRKRSGKGSKIAGLKAARLSAVQTLYQMKAGEQKSRKAVNDYMDHYSGMEIDGEKMLEPDRELYVSIVSGVESNYKDLYATLRKYLNKKSQAKDINDENLQADTVQVMSQTECVLECILICGIYEVIYHDKIDHPIIVSDYIDVAYAFYDKSEANLVNAILDKLAKDVRS